MFIIVVTDDGVSACHNIHVVCSYVCQHLPYEICIKPAFSMISERQNAISSANLQADKLHCFSLLK